MQLNIKNETSPLKAIVLGQPGSIGNVPTLDRVFDAKSYESVSKGIYPTEEAIYKEMSAFENRITSYNVCYTKLLRFFDNEYCFCCYLCTFVFLLC